MAGEELNFILSVVPGAMTGIATLNAGLVSINNAFNDMTRQIDNNFGLVNSSLITIGVVAAQVGAQAASAFGDFEQSMKIVQMVSGETSQAMDYLGQKANEFSIQYRIDIDQITEGLQTLGRAGLNNATEQSEVLQNGLNTAKLEGRELNSVLEELIQNTALLGGDLKSSEFGEQSQYVNDLLVATSMTAPITTHDVSETLKYSGGIAAAAGANIKSEEGKEVLEDYMGAIAAFAQKGVSGSIAGTALRAFFNKPATQDSSVVEALSSIGLAPEYLWEDGGDRMKPVSEQIGIIQAQMKKLNVSTMDQLQIWSKIVGGKMGQQMMKLDSSDIKTLTNDIQKAENAQSLATKSMQTYNANVKELGERGAKAFRDFGESIVFFINPFIELANRILAFMDNDFMKWPLALTFFAFLSKVGSKVKEVLGKIRTELGSLKEYWQTGVYPTSRDLRPQSSKDYKKYDYTLENAQTLEQYKKALSYANEQALLNELKEAGVKDANIGVIASTRSWTAKNEFISNLAGKRVNDADIIDYLSRKDLLTEKEIDILSGPARKEDKMKLVQENLQNKYLKHFNDGELWNVFQNQLAEKEQESAKSAGAPRDDKFYDDIQKIVNEITGQEEKVEENLKTNEEAVRQNTEALNKETTQNKVPTQDDLANDFNIPENFNNKFLEDIFAEDSLQAWDRKLTDKNRILWDAYNKRDEPYSMKLDRGTKVPYTPSWITWIEKHPDRDVDFNRLQLPKFDNAMDEYFDSHPMHSDAKRDLEKKYKNKKDEIVSAFNHYKKEAMDMVVLPFLSVEDVINNNRNGFHMTIPEMKARLSEEGWSDDDINALKQGKQWRRADLAEAILPYARRDLMSFYTTPESFSQLGWKGPNNMRKAAQFFGVPAGGKGINKDTLPQMIADEVNRQIQHRADLEESITQIEEEQAKVNKELVDSYKALQVEEEAVLAQARAKQAELDEKAAKDSKRLHDSLAVTDEDIKESEKKDPRTIGWTYKDEEKKPFKSKMGNPWWYDYEHEEEERKSSPLRDTRTSYRDKTKVDMLEFEKDQEKSSKKFVDDWSKATDVLIQGSNPALNQMGELKKLNEESADDVKESFFKKPDIGVREKFGSYVGELVQGIGTRLTADRSNRTLGYSKKSADASTFKKLANGALNAADMMGGPLMIAMEGLTLVINYVQQLYDEYCQELKDAKDAVNDAYNKRKQADSALEKTYKESGYSDEDIESLMSDTYEQMQNDINSGEWIKKASEAYHGKEYEYDEEKDDGSMKEKEQEEQTAEQAINENTAALYAATGELRIATEKLVSKMSDSWWGIDGWTGEVSDTLGEVSDTFAYQSEGAQFSDEGTFLKTASQKDENYAGYTELAGLMLEDIHDAAGNWENGFKKIFGSKDGVNIANQLSPNARKAMDSYGGFIKGLSRSDNSRLQSSMMRNKKDWQGLAKEIAKYEKKNKTKVGDKKTDNKRLEKLVSKLSTETGLSRLRVLQAASLQQLQDMYEVAQGAIVPTMSSQAETAAQHYQMSANGINPATQESAAGAQDTAANAAAIAAMLSVIAQTKAVEAAWQAGIMAGDKEALEAKDANEYLKKAAGTKLGYDISGIQSMAYGVGSSFANTFGVREEFDKGWNMINKELHTDDGMINFGRYGQSQKAMDNILNTFTQMGERARHPDWNDDQIYNTAVEKLGQYKDEDGNYKYGMDSMMRMARENYQDAITPTVMDAYLASQMGEDDDSGSGGGGGSGGDDSDDKDKGSKKERVDLVLCNKKEIPKLNVNLFKKPPSFTVLNKNFKLRDIKVNTQDKPKAVLSSIKNAIIDVQKRSDPKIIQDESAEYDPVSATEGSSVPSGSTNTGTD